MSRVCRAKGALPVPKASRVRKVPLAMMALLVRKGHRETWAPKAPRGHRVRKEPKEAKGLVVVRARKALRVREDSGAIPAARRGLQARKEFRDKSDLRDPSDPRGLRDRRVSLATQVDPVEKRELRDQWGLKGPSVSPVSRVIPVPKDPRVLKARLALRAP